jgi:hypothetical protein
MAMRQRKIKLGMAYTGKAVQRMAEMDCAHDLCDSNEILLSPAVGLARSGSPSSSISFLVHNFTHNGQLLNTSKTVYCGTGIQYFGTPPLYAFLQILLPSGILPLAGFHALL